MFNTKEVVQDDVSRGPVTGLKARSFTVNADEVVEFKEESVVCNVFVITPADEETNVQQAAYQLARHYAHSIGFSTLLVDGRIERSNNMKEEGQNLGLTNYLIQEECYLMNLISVLEGRLLFGLELGQPGFNEPARQLHHGLVGCLDQLRRHFEVVIIYTDTVVGTPSTQLFVPLADHILLLARQRKTLLEHLKKSKEFLMKCEAKEISILLQTNAHLIKRFARFLRL